MVKGKEQFTLWLSPSVRQEVAELYKKDNCASQSEFIEKALNFYIGFIHTNMASEYLPLLISRTLEAEIDVFGDRMGSLLFKLAVEADMINNLLAADMKLDEETCERLRGRCVYNVKRTNGRITLKNAAEYQSRVIDD